jgi:hypothetical protein
MDEEYTAARWLSRITDHRRARKSGQCSCTDDFTKQKLQHCGLEMMQRSEDGAPTSGIIEN